MNDQSMQIGPVMDIKQIQVLHKTELLRCGVRLQAAQMSRRWENGKRPTGQQHMREAERQFLE